MSMLKAFDAAAAYGQAIGQGGGAAGKIAKDSGGASFGDVLKGMVGEVSDVAKQSEQASIAGLNKNMELTDVVSAVTNAEMVIDTVVAVRDKVINAYQEILRMPI